MVSRIMQTAQIAVNASAASLLLLDNRNQKLYFKIANGPAGPELKRLHISRQSGIAGWIVRNGKPLLVNDAEKNRNFYRQIDQVTGFQTKSIIGAPIVIDDKVAGVIEVLNKNDGSLFSRADLSVMLEVAGALEEIAADDDDAAASDGNAGDMELPKSAMAHRDKVAGVSTKPGFHADAQGKPASAPKGDFQGTGPVEPVTPEPAADQLLFEASDPGSGDANDDTGIDLLTVKNDSAGESLSKTTLSGLGRQDPLNRMEFGGNQATAAGAEIKEATAENKELRNEVIRQIVQRMSMHTQGDQSRMEIRLKPEFLGNVHLQVLTENHQVSVRMTADSMAVKEIVEQNIQHLKLELQQHGLEIQKFDVFVGGDSQQWRGGQNQAGFRQAFRQRQQRFGNSKAGMDDSLGISTVDSNKKYSQTDPNEIDYFV